MARKEYWTIAAPHSGNFVKGMIYWKEDSSWNADPESAHHFRTLATAEKNLIKIQELKPNARVVKINPNAVA
jgi:hypothetical protein|tara:strand:- start:1811 stop:2026 length:216 start_codon:yes stop_codon:yes gene_type:complete